MSPLSWCLLILPLITADVTYYDSFSRALLSSDEVAQHEADGTLFWCVNELETCDATEGRRIDGSCNNLNTPLAGSQHQQFKRLLPPVFDGAEVRTAANGSALPNPRHLRTRILADGRVYSQDFTQLMPLFFIFAATDLATMSIHDTLNYVQNHPNCCDEEGASDPVCVPIPIPADDPVHRFSGLTCLNLTRPVSFQSTGCISSDVTPPHRMNFGTPFFDLSNIYGGTEETSTRQRLFTGGLLNFTEGIGGLDWPQYIAPEVDMHDGIGGLGGINFVYGLWYWREHNRIARTLAELNPCWDDEQLFMTARDINIAQYNQVFYYELTATLMGYDNLVTDGILSSDESFRDPYDSSVEPGLYLESLLSLRWVHLVQDGLVGLYTNTGEKIGEYPEVNLSLSVGTLNTDMIFSFTQGMFRSASGAFDYIMDNVIAEWSLGTLQAASDATTSDLAKNRLFGVGPYVDYLNYCFGGTYESFDDLAEFFSPEHLELLKELYTDVRDIDVTAALWAEKLREGTRVPITYYCLFGEQLKRSVSTDRHWFERSERPGAFTAEQLASIRQVTAAKVLCDNGDGVTEIQQCAFLRESESNPSTACSDIAGIDLTLWQDSTCST